MLGLPRYNQGYYYFWERGVQAILHLRVIAPFLAMRQSSLRPAFFTVPKGAVVETSYELHQPGLVLIKLEDQSLFAFMRDLREQAEPVYASASSLAEE